MESIDGTENGNVLVIPAKTALNPTVLVIPAMAIFFTSELRICKKLLSREMQIVETTSFSKLVFHTERLLLWAY